VWPIGGYERRADRWRGRFRPIKPTGKQGGEMIDWPRPEGGRVFNAATRGAGRALGGDPLWSAMLRDVLHHFGVTRARISDRVKTLP
jgi:hypothetical protein